jgi:hypothetical protein
LAVPVVLEVAPPEELLLVSVEAPLLLAELFEPVVATVFPVLLNVPVALVLCAELAEAFKLPVNDFDELAFRELLEDLEAVAPSDFESLAITEELEDLEADALSESVELFELDALELDDALFIELAVSEMVFDALAVNESLLLLVVVSDFDALSMAE